MSDRVAPPATLVVFGASGDLAKRKILPALQELWKQKLLGEPSTIVGFARSKMDAEAFRASVRQAVPGMEEGFLRTLDYVAGEYDDEAAYRALGKKLTGRRLFYLSTPPSVYAPVIERLGSTGLADDPEGGWSRIIIEKPFGVDLASARGLNALLHKSFDESQVYRIDHYLGKETVQNLLVLRFANGIFEPIWNRGYIDHVQLTMAESLGVEGRSGYYEQAGAVRDMFQNHILQVLSLIAMEPPASFEAEAVRNEKLKVLQALNPILPGEVDAQTVRGQYNGYREEPGVAKDSGVETFAAFKLAIDNWRWAGVPFYVRTGKKLPSRVTEIAIEFKHAPHLMFKNVQNAIKPNVLTVRVQPDEGISLAFEAKVPGQTLATQHVKMDFKYAEAFGAKSPEAYERLLLDCLVGDATLFNRADSVETSWAFVMPILETWAKTAPSRFPNYAAGSWGPSEAYALIERDGRWWRKPS